MSSHAEVGKVFVSRHFCSDYRRVCRAVVAILLLVTSLLKFHAVVVDDVSIHVAPFPPWLLFGAAAIEIMLASMLVRHRSCAVATVCGFLAFTTFVIVGSFIWSRGFDSCGCFGVFSPSLVVLLLLNLSALLLLWLARPRPFGRQLIDEYRFLCNRGELCSLITAFVAIAIGTLLLGTSSGRQYLGLSSFRTIVAESVELPMGQPGDWVVGEVKVSNQSEVQCEIIGEQASCNCIRVGDLPDAIPPGKTISVPFKIRIPDEQARLEKVIIFYLRHPEQFAVTCVVRGSTVAPAL